MYIGANKRLLSRIY